MPVVGEGHRRKTEQRAGAAMGLGGWAAVGRALESSPASTQELMGPNVPSLAGKGQALHPGRTAAHRAVVGVGDSLVLAVVGGADPPRMAGSVPSSLCGPTQPEPTASLLLIPWPLS